MRYLCLVYVDPDKLARMSGDDRAMLEREAGAYGDELRASGHYLGSDVLEPASRAVTVRCDGAGIVVSDGPFAETKEQLGGFVMIEARDFNEALRIGARIPPGRLGCVEVRPVRCEHC